MTLAFPYSLAYFADRLPIAGVEWTVKRRDKLSGQASGRIWQAELAPPLWMGVVELDRRNSQEIKQYAAQIRAMHGAQEKFFLFDPLSPFPQSDPRGLILGNAQVRVNSIGADRRSLSFSGLPAGYVLTLGDKLQMSYGADPVRSVFMEISETGAASGSGVTPELGVYPHIPVGINVAAIVVLAKPACRMVIMPDTHMAGRARRHLTEGAGFTAIESP